MIKIRLLPLVVLLGCVLLGAKMYTLYSKKDGLHITHSYMSHAAYAAEETKESKVEALEAEKDAAQKKEKKGFTANDLRYISDKELELLLSLAKRRDQLSEWEKALQERENILKVAESKLEKKLTELKNLQSVVENLLVDYNERELVKIRSLVKIYENMKPVDAARIFEEMDMTVLLQVVDTMKEAKVAPILAQMKPSLAKDITERLATLRSLPDESEVAK